MKEQRRESTDLAHAKQVRILSREISSVRPSPSYTDNCIPLRCAIIWPHMEKPNRRPFLLELASTDSWCEALVVYAVGVLVTWGCLWSMGQLAAMEYAGR